MNTAMHWTTIGAMILLGLGMGLAFDAYRVACGRFDIRRWMLPGLDFLYWVAATVAAFQILLASNFGEVRLYVFLGIGIGVTGYFGLFSPFMRKLVALLYAWAGTLCKWLWKAARMLLIVPVFWLVRTVARLLDILFIVAVALLLWIAKLLMKPFAGIGRRIGQGLGKRLFSPMAQKWEKWWARIRRKS